jgi:predicted dinucleotide-binding enzyme
MPTLGIIGSGNIGAAVARLAVTAGIPVVMSNSRGPESLAGIIADLGPLASAGTVDQAAGAGDLVLLSVPLTAHAAIPRRCCRARPCSTPATTTRSEMAGSRSWTTRR